MKEQDKTLKQALRKAANEGAIAENPAVEITPSAELDKKMNAFFNSVENQNTNAIETESAEQQYSSDRSETVGNNYGDALLNAFESDIADYDSDYDDSDSVESKNRVVSNVSGFGGKIRSLFVPFSRRTVGVILFAIAGVLLVVSLISMAKTAAANNNHDSNPTPSEQPTLSGTAIPEGGTPTPRTDGKDTDSTAQPGITKNPNGTPGPGEFRTSAPVSGAPTSAPVTDAPKTQIPAPATTTPGGGGRPTNPPATPTTAPSTGDPIVRPTPGEEPTDPITDSPTDEPVVTDEPTDAPTDEPVPPTDEPAPEPTEAPTEPPVTPEEPGE